jgi:mono/diheme cytochrome c family protein
VVALNLRGEEAITDSPTDFASTPQLVERGRYLALAGNCAGCHTARGGAPYAGGRGIDTPFGTVYASNLTPDDATGLGRWSASAFWRAMHHGRSRDGRLLYPAFPYPSFTHVTRDDSDAIYAYLRSLPPAARPNSPNRLRFPYDTQAALAVWRAVSFKPGSFVADAAKPAEWNRGAYLVEGLGHCIACHGSRNVLGAVEETRGLAGGSMPVDDWLAPSLTAPREAGVQDWPVQDVIALLHTGTSPRGSVMGPMAEVVWRSTQHLSPGDVAAIAVYLKALPVDASAARTVTARRDAAVMARGGRIYDQRCAYCHGDRGEGAPGAYPALAGNRAVQMASPTNLIQAVRHGGFLPATAGNPRPFGMPPFGHVLNDDDVAAVLTYIRGSWGNDADAVSLRQTARR